MCESEEPRTARLRDLMGRVRREPERLYLEEDEARRLGVSPAHFRRLFRVTAGVPFRAFCLRARMDRAASLLRNEELPIKDGGGQMRHGGCLPFLPPVQEILRRHAVALPVKDAAALTDQDRPNSGADGADTHRHVSATVL